MWARASNLYGQLPSVRGLWAGQQLPPQAAARPDGGSEGSFRTAEEGAPELRLYSPQGGVYSPSVPSTRAFGGGGADARRAGPAPEVVMQQEAATAGSAPVRPAHAPAPAPAPSPSHAPAATDERRASPVAPLAATTPAAPALAEQPSQPVIAGGLMERLKAQRAARAAQAGEPAPVVAAAPVHRPPVSLPHDSVAPRAPTHTSAPPPSPRATPLPSPPLQPFDSPPTSANRTPCPADTAVRYPWSEELAPAALADPHGYGDWLPYSDYEDPAYAHLPTHPSALLNEPFEPSPLQPSVPHSYPFRPASASAPSYRPDTRASDRTLLHESAALPPQPQLASPPHASPGAPPEGSPKGSGAAQQAVAEGVRADRGALLAWERERRAAERAAAGGATPAGAVQSEGTVWSSWGWEEATAALRDGQSAGAREERREEELQPEEILAQDWLLLPPPERLMTDGLLSFPDLWHPVYAVLTPSHLYLLLDDDTDPVPVLAVSDLVRTARETIHARSGFEPFFVELKGGARRYFAGTRELDAALWTLKLKCAHAQKDPRWMRAFHADVPVRAVIEELPRDAGADDWGGGGGGAQWVSPRAQAPAERQEWPSRPPTEVYEPPSPSPLPVPQEESQHALDLRVMLDRLELIRAMVDQNAEDGGRRDEHAAREAAEELRALREMVLWGAAGEGRGLTREEEAVVDKIMWLEHLNEQRLHPSAEQSKLAHVAEEERRLVDEVRRELEKFASGAARHWEEPLGEGGSGWYGGSRSPTRQDEHHVPLAHSPLQYRASSLPGAQPAALASKFSSNTSAPPGHHHYSTPHSRHHQHDVPPSGHQGDHDLPQPQYDSEYSFGGVGGDGRELKREERRRRLQELFLDLEQRIIEQKRHLALSEEKNQQLTRTLGKMFKLVEHSQHLHSSQLATLLARLDTLTSTLLAPDAFPPQLPPIPSTSTSSSTTSFASKSTPTPPPPYFPTSPLAPRPRAAAGRTGDRQSMALVLGDGRMAARLLPRVQAQALAQAPAPAPLLAGQGAGSKGGRIAAPLVEAKGKGKAMAGGPVYGVDPSLPKAAHAPRWAGGAKAARRAREVEALRAKLEAPTPPRGAVQGRELVEEERVKAAVEVLRAGRVGMAEKADAAGTAVAVWEVLEEARRARRAREEEEEKRKRGAGKRGLGKGRAA
ncbi:hypothetical protein JCM10450v2_005794 [Rhodotorula kratochvilovae]